MAAAPKTYFATANYRFLRSDRDAPLGSDSVFELDEADVWSGERSASPERRKAVPSPRVVSRKQSSRGERVARTAPASLPVNVPDWSKILKEENRRRDGEDGSDGEDMVPPHEFLDRQLARARIASFSVHEGLGRTLKGRDLSKVRNAIWEKTGFQD
ncbi:unnamed protein product [Cuscuta campestris]|uniref:Senescence regulator S40 n=1 Tax=Cuscuta campestris TaxID=132261 RepID=A0A484M092_9ASTE|nr:unnamed protein product [Cuscuta campestris]